MVKSPEDMQPLLASKNIENMFFKKHLRNFKSELIDQSIHTLSKQITSQIDCTTCANCCKKLEPGLEENEIVRLVAIKQTEPHVFKQNFVEFDGEAQFLKTKPCMFLNDCKCGIYESRPNACAGYPHLDGKDMKYKRSLWSNYTICPIVFNVIEALKSELKFTYGS
jgi:hypothetical protein